MSNHTLLGRLSGLHQMMSDLLQAPPEPAVRTTTHPALAPPAWYFGRAVYLETYWLREVIQGDAGMTARVREIFTPGALPEQEQWRRLPPREHLINWALELWDENLTRLANPRQLPQHPLRERDRHLHILLQEGGRLYEQMLMAMTEWRLLADTPYQCRTPLAATAPQPDMTGISQGHYRIGARDDPAAYNNEQPAQIIRLSSFQIDRRPVTNANYLAFMQAGGYSGSGFWDAPALIPEQPHPRHWRQDNHGGWYGVGLNGASDLIGSDPVMGVSQHEAQAYARWLDSLAGPFAGAVLQHEYQWEAAVRIQAIEYQGRVWEWCANPFHPYSDYLPSGYGEGRTGDFDQQLTSLRGASLHTQPSLRRISFRNRAPARANWLFAGFRLVYPPIAIESGHA
ncbi:MAG: SUMF1/EgtB/PvdO family nonheme iron enzyme [Candidatus Sedimenticola endophacoides]